MLDLASQKTFNKSTHLSACHADFSKVIDGPFWPLPKAKPNTNRATAKAFGAQVALWQKQPTVAGRSECTVIRTPRSTLTTAFVTLKFHLPSLRAHTKRVSKLKILNAAISYIDSLVAILKSIGYDRATLLAMSTTTAADVDEVRSRVAAVAPEILR
ncbi:Helix-loop-helix DNA-binding domain protein [Cooperia oncophora]